jgi:hypothetical protein
LANSRFSVFQSVIATDCQSKRSKRGGQECRLSRKLLLFLLLKEQELFSHKLLFLVFDANSWIPIILINALGLFWAIRILSRQANYTPN